MRARMKVLVALAAMAMASACAVPGKVTGGGTIPGPNGGKANLGFNGDSCSGDVTGQFNYVDIKSKVKANGDVVKAKRCVDADTEDAEFSLLCGLCKLAVGVPSYGLKVNYRSTEPTKPGAGTAIACVVDNGQGAKATGKDLAAIYVIDGPFGGYSAKGPVQGNIKSHACTS